MTKFYLFSKNKISSLPLHPLFKDRLGFYLFLLIFLSATSTAISQSCTVNAGLPQTICANDVMQLDGTSPSAVYANGPIWSQVSGPAVIISDPTIDDPVITGFIPGNTYEFAFSAECPNGDTPSQTVAITVNPITIADAGSDIASCPDSTGSIIISGNSPGPGETGVWSIVGANNANVTINLPGSASTPITLPDTNAGTSTLRWTITGSGVSPCSSFDEITITNYGGELPISAGNDITLSNCYTVSQSTNFNASFGGNNINGQQGTWTFVSGPSDPTSSIANINNANSGISNLIEGTYTFRWDVVGPCASGSDTVSIIVPGATQDVTDARIDDDNIRLCDATATQITLVGTTPDFTNETVLWELISGPPVTIVNPTNSTTQVTGLSNPNSYQFRYTITNNVTGCTSTDTGRVRYNSGNISITVNSGNDIVGICGETSIDVPFSFMNGNQTQYSIISGPDDSAITFPTNYQTQSGTSATIDVFDVPGIYRVNFRRRRTGDQLTSCGEANDAINITISAPPSGSNAGTSQSFLCGQVDGTLAGSSVALGEQSVWTQVSGPNAATIADIYAQTTAISGMIPGTYIFRYTVSAGPTCTPPSVSDTTIEVSPVSNFPVNAGVDQIDICVGAPVQLAADPGTAAQTGVWTAADPGISFSDINDPNAIATGFSLASTTYTLTWTLDIVDNSGCTLAPASDTVDITTNADASPTAANAGVDQCLAGGVTNVSLSGNAPDPLDEEGLWTVSPGAGVTFAPNATQFDAVATVPSDGVYTFTWTIGYAAPPTNSCPTTADDVEIVIADVNTSVSAGTDKSLCLDPVLLSFDMDADPPPAGGTGTWMLFSGGRFSVDDENSPTATFSNLLDGTYVFEWVIDFGDCPVTTPTDQVTVEVGIPPTTANIQGGDQVICAANNTTITADALVNPSTESGVWSVVSGPNTPTISDPSNENITVTGLTTGTYVFNWTVTSSSPLCPTSTDTINVDVFAPTSAGPDQDLCEVTSTLLEATAGTTGTWTQVANGAPASTITQSPANSNTANASLVPGNTYIFRFTTDYPTGPPDCNNSSEVTITVSSGPSVPPTAGADQILCEADTTTTTLAGSVPPGDAGLTATWSFLAEPATSVANITTPGANNTTVTGLSEPGIYILQWNFAIDNCSDEADIMRIEVFEAPTPIDAGPDQTNACQQDAQLAATAPTVGIGVWSFANPGDDPSSGVITIDSPNNPQTTLSNVPDDIGNDGLDDIYVLTWTVSNGGPFPSPPSACDPQSDTVTVTFTGVPPTPADAGPDQDLCDDTQTFLDAVDITSGTGTWTQTSGPAGPTIAAPNNPNSLVIDLVPGTFEFTWTVVGGGCTSADTMEVVIQSDPITTNAGPDQSVPEFTTVTLGATAAPVPAVGMWSQVSGPTTANFIDATDPTTQVTGTIAGTYVFEWTITNGTCDPRSDRVNIQITPIVDLELTKTVLPAAAKIGETVTFTVAIFNNTASGTSDASDVEVIDIIPAGYSLVPGTVSNSGLYNAGNLSITWSNINVPNGATVNLTFNATVNATGPYNNSAQIIGSNEFDPDSTPNNNIPAEDDQDEATVTITPNDPPVAMDDENLANTLGDPVPVIILNNDTDSDGTLDPESVDLVPPVGATGIVTDLDGDVIAFTVPGEGSWSYDDDTGELLFSPEPGFTGNPTDITYTVRDDSGNTSNIASVNIEYTFTPPIANDDTNPTPTPINNNTVLNIINNDELADGNTPNPSDVNVDLDLDPLSPGIQNSLNVPGQGDWTYAPGTGVVTFDPEPTFTGSPTPITYELTDLDNNQTDTALITIVYQQPPIANDDESLANTVGTTISLTITTNDNDPDGLIDPATVNLIAPVGATGVVTDLNGDVVEFIISGQGTWSYNDATGLLDFDPEDGFTGNPTDITYTVRDDDGNVSNVATINVEYAPTPPVANDDTNPIATVIGSNTNISILTNDELADGSTPGVSDVSIDLDLSTAGIQTSLNVPGQGDWTYAPGTGVVTFDPEPTFTGSPTPITYELTDLDNNQTDTALITIVYQQPPIANDDESLANTVGTTISLTITTNDNDPDGLIDPATVNLIAPVGATGVVTDLNGDVVEFIISGQGTWSYNDATGLLDFDPEDGFTGNPTDITYTVRDDDGNVSNVATINVEYAPTPPVANDDTNPIATVIGSNTNISILTNDELADGSTPGVSDVSIDLDLSTAGIQTSLNVPGQGDWTYAPGTGVVTFDPEPAFTGNPTPITYELTDLDNNQTDTALVTVIYQVPPVADNDTSSGNTVGATVNVPILTGDTDADGTIDATTVNLIPIVGATDIITSLDGDVIGFTVPDQGVWSYDDVTGQLSFDPEDGFTGSPTDITYTVDDNDGNTSNIATVSVGYTPTPPVANDDTNPIATVIGSNTDVSILTNDELADGSIPGVSDVSIDLDLSTAGIQTSLNVPGQGDWTYAPGTGVVTFDPEPTFTGNPTPITYELTDLDNNQTDTALVTVIYQVPPVADNDTSSGNTVGATVNVPILTGDTDADGTIDATTVNLIPIVGATDIITSLDGDVIGFTVPGQGVWSYDDVTGQLSFDPEDGFTGSPTDITYTVDDNDGNTSNIATVSVGYTPTPPVANDDTNPIATVIGSNTDVSILTNDELADGSIPGVSDVSIDLDLSTAGIQTSLNVPGQGDWTYAPGTGVVTFDPEPTFTGNPTPITYELTDLDNNQTDTALVTVIYQVPPVADNDTSSGNTVGATVNVPILTGDTDADGTIDATTVNLIPIVGATDIITSLDGDVIGFTVPGQGVWSYDDVTGQLSFDPEDGFTGSPTDITYTVDDNDGNTSNIATVSVGYTPTPPVANDDTNPIATVIGSNTDVSILTNDELADGSIPGVSDVSIDLDLSTAGIQTSLNVPGQGDWTYAPGTGVVTFDPEPTFTGNPTPITYELTDLDNNQTDTALITVIYQVPPVADNDTSSGNTVGATVNVPILTGDTDADGTIDATTVNLIPIGGATTIITSLDGDVIGFTVPGQGVWSYDDVTGQLSFDPEDGFTGNPTDITYTVDDNDGNTSNIATVSVGYTPTPPVANDDTNPIATVIGSNTDISILTNDELADGSTPGVSDVSIDLDLSTAGIQTSLNVPGQGDWTYAPGTGVVTFDPEPTFTGNPTPITYELTDLDNNRTDTALVTVIYQVPPVADNDTSSGNTVGATVNVPILTGDTDADGTIDATTVNLIPIVGATDIITSLDGDVIGFTVPGQGVWSYDDVTGQLSFDPEDGFTGNPTDITYTVDDNDGNTSNIATVSVGYTPTPPIANDDNSSGNPTNNSVTLNIINNDVLADGSTPLPNDVIVDLIPPAGATAVVLGVNATTIGFSVPNEGDWLYNEATGEIMFIPNVGFTNDPTPIDYNITDIDNTQVSVTPATITIDYVIQSPLANDDEDLDNNPGDIVAIMILTNDNDPDGALDENGVNLVPPTSATGIIVDGDGDIIEFDVPNEGTWTYVPGTQTLSFDPLPTFITDPTPINYSVDDNDGNISNIAEVRVGYIDVADLSLVKRVVDNDITPFTGTEITFEIRVTNDGPANATGVSVTDLLPSGYDFILYSSTSGVYDEISGVWNIGSIPSGDTETLLIDVLINETGIYTNVAEVTASGTLDLDSMPNNNILTEDDQESIIVTPVLTPRIDLSVTKVADNLTPNVGGQIVFNMTVTNNGPSDATNVVVTDLLASGYEYVSSTVSVGSYEPLNGSWTVGNVANGNTETLIITANVLAVGDYTNVVEVTDATENDIDSTPANNDDTEDDQVTIEPVPVSVADLRVTKSVNNASPEVGSSVLFTILLENLGLSNDRNIVVTDLLPTGYTFASYEATAGVYDDTTGLWTVNRTLIQGDIERLTITASVNPTGIYTNIAEITASDNLATDPNIANNTSSIGTVPIPIADLSLTKTVDNIRPDVTDIITFTLTLTNDGPSEATGVIITDVLPSGFNLVSDTSGGLYNSGTGEWSVGNLAIGATTSIDIVVSINTLGNYINTAEVTAVNEMDPDSTPNNDVLEEDDQQEVQVLPRVITDISINKEVDVLNPSVGNQITFTVTITNDGPSNATGIVVEDLLASGYQFDNATPSVGVYDETIGSWDIGNLANGVTETLTITVTVLPSGNYSNTAELIALDTFDPDSNPDNNVDSEDDQDTVNPMPTGLADLSLEKTVNNETPLVGETVEFIINVTNSGDSDATGVEITDQLPIGYTFVSFVATAGLYDSTTGIWTINGTILNGSTESLIILATVNEPTNSIDEYINIAEITRSDQADPDSDSTSGVDDDDLGDGIVDDDESTVIVRPQFVDIAITKIATPVNVTIGEEVVFTITATNNDNMIAATNVVISDILPSGYRFVSSSASNGEYNQVSGLWTIPTINNSETETLRITVEVLDIDDYINIAALLDIDQFDGDASNDSGEAFVITQCLTVFNEFSPNNDGTNDTFTIDCITQYPDNRLEIYNRWGNIVFEKDGYDNTWDGTSNGRAVIYVEDKLPVGTYYYILDLGDGTKPKSGWIYLNR